MKSDFRIGDPVVWAIRDRVTGEVLRTISSFIRAYENVRQSDGTIKACAVLACNRLAPVEDLCKPDETPEVIKKPRQDREPNNNSKPMMPQRRQDDKANQEAKRETPASPSECRLLAIDFLNVLVRAWHAGAPSDSHAVRSLFQTTANAIRALNPAHVVFALDGGHAKRTELLPSYKAHRPESDPNLQAQKKLAEDALKICGFQAIRVIDWEADDVLASLAMAYDDTVIVSSDKDLLSLPAKASGCRIYHPWGAGKFVTANDVLKIDAHLVTDYLALCGDKTDGIPGVRGIGDKTAVQLLAEFESLEGILSAAVQGKVKGTRGTQLSEQRNLALLSRDLIELNDALPLPAMSAFRPAAGWHQRLQENRLGSVAAIVDALHRQRCVTFSGDMPANIKIPASVGREFPNEIAGAQSVDSHPPLAEKQTSPESTISIDVETLLSISSKADWSTPRSSAITCWHAGRENSDAPNPWKAGTWNHVAWAQGNFGVPLHVTISDEAELITVPRPEQQRPQAKNVESSNPRKSGNLFE